VNRYRTSSSKPAWSRTTNLWRECERLGFKVLLKLGFSFISSTAIRATVAAAKAEVEKARQGLQRVDLSLRDRFAAVTQSYRNARVVVERYHDEILPRAQRAYELMVTRYGLMTASYPQVLTVQRTLYQTETGYISALETLWMNSIVLQGFLLSGGLEMRGQADEMDLEPMPASSMFDRTHPP